MLFKDWLRLKESYLFTEADLLDDLIFQLQKYNKTKHFDLGVIDRAAYDYLTKHDDRSKAVRNLLKTDIATYNQYNAKYKQLLDMVAQKLSGIGYTFDNNGAWAQYNRNGGKGNAQKDDNMTTKRYVSLDMNDIWKAFQKLPVLGEALNKVQLRPEADRLSFKVGSNYGTAMEHKDTIVIHFYDKTAGPQIDQAVQTFLNAAGIKEADRSAFNRVNFGKDSGGTSDSDLISRRVAKYFEINKDKIPQMLQMPDLKQQLKKMIDNISMNSSHRAGVTI